MDNLLKDFKEKMEYDLLFQLTLNIKAGKLSLEEAQIIAKEYINLKPTSKETLLQGLIDIGCKHDVVQAVIAKFSEEFDQEFKDEVLSKMKDKMNSGDIEEAIKIGNIQKGVSP